MFLRDHIDAVGADGKERIGQRGDDQADRFRFESTKRARHLIGTIAELCNGSMNPLCRAFADVCGVVQDARDGHRPHLGESRNIDHSGFLMHFVELIPAYTGWKCRCELKRFVVDAGVHSFAGRFGGKAVKALGYVEKCAAIVVCRLPYASFCSCGWCAVWFDHVVDAVILSIDLISLNVLPLLLESAPIDIGLCAVLFVQQKKCVERLHLNPPLLAKIVRFSYEWPGFV